MSLITIATNAPVYQSGTDSVSVAAAETPGVAGAAPYPFPVTPSQAGGGSLPDVITISNTTVMPGGAREIPVLPASWRDDTASAPPPLAVHAANDHLALNNVPLATIPGSAGGFGPGNRMDVPLAVAAITGSNFVTDAGGATYLTGVGLNAFDIPLSSGVLTAALFGFGLDACGIDLTSTVADMSAVDDVQGDDSVISWLDTGDPVAAVGSPLLLLGSADPLTIAVRDQGTPVLDLAQPTATGLVSDHTVQADLTAPDCLIAAVALSGGTIGDDGNTLLLSTVAPMVTATVVAPGTGAVRAGQSISITVATSEPVAVAGGIPVLLLDNGGTAAYSSVASTPTSLVFLAVVQAGENSPGLSITGTQLNGATIADAAGNALWLGSLAAIPRSTLVVDTAPPTITSILATPPFGRLGVGQVVQLWLVTSEAVTVVGGPPRLLLDDGGIASFDFFSSTPMRLAFTYMVQVGRNSANLAIASIDLAGATVADAAGNPLDLGGIANLVPGLTIDTAPPAETSTSSAPANAVTVDLVGSTVSLPGAVMGAAGIFRMDMAAMVMAVSAQPQAEMPTADQSVEIIPVLDAIPTLRFTDDGVAFLDSSRTTLARLAFLQTVPAGQGTTDLAAIGAALNGAVVAAEVLDLSEAPGNWSGIPTIGAMPSVAAALLSVTGADAVGPVVPNAAARAIDLGTVPAATQSMGVYRFFEVDQGTSFLTGNTAQHGQVVAFPPGPGDESGNTVYAQLQLDPATTPVLRFLDAGPGTQFDLGAETEPGTIAQFRPDLTYDAISVYDLA